MDAMAAEDLSVILPRVLIVSRRSVRKNKFADFSNAVLSQQQERRLTEMGATVRNALACLEKMKANEERENMARRVMATMSADQLTDLLSFYHTMAQICSEVLESKLHGLVNHDIGPFHFQNH